MAQELLIFLLLLVGHVFTSHIELNSVIPLWSLDCLTLIQQFHWHLLHFEIGIRKFEEPFCWTWLVIDLKTCNSPSSQIDVWFLASLWNYPYHLCSYCSLPPWFQAVKVLPLPSVFHLSCLFVQFFLFIFLQRKRVEYNFFVFMDSILGLNFTTNTKRGCLLSPVFFV